MSDTKITALAAISTVDPAADVLPIVDVSDTSMAASGTTKKITSNQLLGAGGTATLASATITGDLTVDTSTLKVDSANNRVIVGHTSGSSPFQVTNAGAAGLEIQPTGVNSAPALLSYNRSTAAYTQLTYLAANHVFQIGATQAMTLDASGNLLVGPTSANANGGVLQLKSGITFPATQVASSDANTLDDYEEGTWTPVFADATTGGNVATAASAVGIYTKIGNIVTVQYQLESINTTGLTAGNVAYIRGLPFSVVSTPASSGHVMTGNVAFGGYLSSNCINGGTQILMYDCLTGGLLSTRVVSNFTSGSASVYGSFSYRVA